MALQQAEPEVVETPSTPPPGPVRPRFTAREGWAERMIDTIEARPALGAIAGKLTGAFSKIVRPGSVKDLLSGTWMGHPAHPMLTDVTIGAWTTAVTLDVLPSSKSDRSADTLVGLGVLSALPTAVTGLSDLADVEDKRERAVGGAHALGNVAATVLFALSYLMRKRGRRSAGVALSFAGAGAATAAGFLGGHLAYRRGIGVDRTVFDDAIGEWTATIEDDELGDLPKRARIGRNDVMLYRDAGRIVAIANRCSHRGGPLHKGTVADGRVTCPWHASTFRLDDGSIVCGPATAPQPVYDVRVREGRIEVRSL